MISRALTISNKLGLHARAAGALVKLASSFSSEISVAKEGKRVNAKSIMGLLMLAAAKGSSIHVEVDGEDERDAIEAIEDLLRRKFDEE
jgi:phosphocarrier protein